LTKIQKTPVQINLYPVFDGQKEKIERFLHQFGLADGITLPPIKKPSLK